MSAPKPVYAIGSINMDLVAQAPRLPVPGETVLGDAFDTIPGGKGANQAVAASRFLPGAVSMVGAIGTDDYGNQLARELLKDNVNLKYVRRMVGERSGVALIVVDPSGQNQIVVAPGANATIVPEMTLEIHESIWSRGGVLLASLEAPIRAVGAFLERAKQFGWQTILNPAPAPTTEAFAAIAPHVDVVTPNETELKRLSGIESISVDNLAKGARFLRELGCKAVVVTLGSEGAMAFGPSESEWASPYQIEPEKVTAIDTTAAGDAFNGVLAAAMAEGRAWDESLRLANRAAGISVTRRGAQPSLPHRTEILEGT